MHAETVFKFLVLLIVLAMLWAISEWLVRYKKGFYQKTKGQFLQKIEAISLGSQHSLQLIKIGEKKIVLVAISPNRTDIILNLEADELEPLNKYATPTESNKYATTNSSNKYATTDNATQNGVSDASEGETA